MRHRVDYEAEAAIGLEALARTWDADVAPYAFGVAGASPTATDAGPVVRAVVDDLRGGVPVAQIAARFHAAVAALVVRPGRARARARPGSTWWRSAAACSRTRCCCGQRAGAGGTGVHGLRPRLLPPNDGGIALGQILVGSVG